MKKILQQQLDLRTETSGRVQHEAHDTSTTSSKYGGDIWHRGRGEGRLFFVGGGGQDGFRGSRWIQVSETPGAEGQMGLKHTLEVKPVRGRGRERGGGNTSLNSTKSGRG